MLNLKKLNLPFIFSGGQLFLGRWKRVNICLLMPNIMNLDPIFTPFLIFLFFRIKIYTSPLILAGGQKKCMWGEGGSEGMTPENLKKIAEYLPTKLNLFVFSLKYPIFRGSGGGILHFMT